MPFAPVASGYFQIKIVNNASPGQLLRKPRAISGSPTRLTDAAMAVRYCVLSFAHCGFTLYTVRAEVPTRPATKKAPVFLLNVICCSLG